MILKPNWSFTSCKLTSDRAQVDTAPAVHAAKHWVSWRATQPQGKRRRETSKGALGSRRKTLKTHRKWHTRSLTPQAGYEPGGNGTEELVHACDRTSRAEGHHAQIRTASAAACSARSSWCTTANNGVAATAPPPPPPPPAWVRAYRRTRRRIW